MRNCRRYRGSPPLQRGEERFSAPNEAAIYPRALALGTSSGVCTATDNARSHQVPQNIPRLAQPFPKV